MATIMIRRRPALKARVKVRGADAIDRRTVAAEALFVWLSPFAADVVEKNPAFDFLNDPTEEVHTAVDGKPFRDEG